MIQNYLRLALAAIAMLVIATPSTSFACSMTSNPEVTIALGDPAPHTVDPDEILEGTPSCAGPYIVAVFNTNGTMRLDPIIDCDDVGRRLLVKVTASTGNSVWSYLTVVDNLKPVVTATNITITCVDDIEALGRAAITASDNCTPESELEFRITSIPSSVGCANGIAQTFVRSIFVVDEHGNRSATVPQTITVARVNLADIVFPPNITYLTSDTTICPAAFGTPAIEYPTVNGLPISSICKILTTVEDEELSACGSSRKILRTFKILDCCTNETRESFQVITIMDNQAPLILTGIGQALPDTINAVNNQGNLNCTGTAFFPAITAQDSCSSDPLTYRITTPFGQIFTNGGSLNTDFSLLAGESFQAIYEVRDACGNLALDTVVVLREDNLPPIAICDQLTTVSLATATTTIPAINFDDGSYDNCGIDSFTVRRMGDIDWETSVAFTCDDVLDTVLVEFRVTDYDGNSNICMVQVIVEDKIPASVNPLPTVTFTCIRNPVDTFFSGVPTVNEVCVGGYTLDTIINDDSMLQCRTGVQKRKFIFTNAAGVMIMTTQMINYVDSGSFTIPTALADTTVDCSLDVLALPTRTFRTDCDVFAVNTSAATTRTIDCRTIEYNIVYNYMPLCGNGPGFILNRKITQIDNEGPTWDPFPGDIDSTYACVLPGTVLAPTATDACNAVIVELVDFTTVPGGNPNCPDVTNTYTWMTRDACGNENPIPFVRVITLRDEIAPTFGVIADVVVDCKAEIRDTMPAYILVNSGVTDNCPSSVNVRIVANVIDTADACIGSIIRTYLATDVCGNSSTASQTISYDQTGQNLVLDTLPSVFNLKCYTEVINFPTPTLNTFGGSICGDGLTITSTTTDPDPGTCPATVIRLFSVQDVCGNTGAVSQTFTFNDTTPPVLSGSPVIDVQCQSDVPTSATTIADLTVTDNCTLISTTSVDVPFAGNTACSGSILRTYTATDACSNTATITQSISWTGEGALTLTPLAGDGIVYSCYDDILAVTQLTDPAIFGEGFCGTSLQIDSVNHSASPGCAGNVLRGYYLQDGCGNRDSVFQAFVLEDTTGPTLLGVADLSVNCFGDIPDTTTTKLAITVMDNCPTTTARFHVLSDTPTNTSTCVGAIVRTYIATDACSNTSTVSQTISFDATGVLMLSDLPPYPDTLTCLQEVVDFPLITDPTAFGVGLCGTALSISPIVLYSTPTNSCLDSVFRSYILTDGCGNADTVAQKFIIRDNVAPAFGTPAALRVFTTPLSGECEVRISYSNTAIDGCGNDPLILTNNAPGAFNPNSLRTLGSSLQLGHNLITFTAEDQCGNQAVIVDTVRVREPLAPNIDCRPVIFHMEPDGTVETTLADISDSLNIFDLCSPFDTTFSGPLMFDCDDAGLAFNMTIVATDTFGNITTCATQIGVEDPPLIDCQNLTYTLPDNGTLTITEADVIAALNVRDICTPDDLTIFFNPGLPMTFACPLATNPVVIPFQIQIFDGDGDETVCDFNLSVRHTCTTPTQDPFALAGRVDAPLYGGTMDSTLVTLEFDGGSMQTHSDANGQYSFVDVPPGAISLSAKLPMTPAARVTTYDMLRVGQHLLGTSELKEPLLLLAADVNKSGSISAFDLTAIRRVILGQDPAFGGLHEAATIGAYHPFSDENDPWMDASNWGTQFEYVSEDMMSLDISAVKLGDINPNAFLIPRGASELILEDAFVRAGETVEVLVRNDYQTAISGLQLAVISNGPLVVSAADANVDVLSNQVNGALRISILHEMLPGEPLMSWTFTPSTSGMLSDLIQISEDIPNESYAAENNQPSQLALHWNSTTLDGAQAEINAFPNPFDNHLSISAHLIKEGKHTLQVTDMTGRSFAERRIEVGQNSWHNLRLDTEAWPSGVYILTLEGPSGRLTQRVVLQH
ncbi:MAG: T9SS type A sorting domain-containing protein [Saprospiraceae bacterium]